MLTTDHKLHFKSGRRMKKLIGEPVEDLPALEARLPRVTKMMALAIRLDHLIKSGQVKDQAELARLAHVSRARLTQIMNLLQLAPDIQERLLCAQPSLYIDRIFQERSMRRIAAIACWGRQREELACTIAAQQ